MEHQHILQALPDRRKQDLSCTDPLIPTSCASCNPIFSHPLEPTQR